MFNNDQKPLFMVAVQRESVEKLDISLISDLIKKLKPHGRNARSSVNITFSGYEYELEEIFEIMEIRKWVEKLFREIPYILYYAESEIEGMKNLLLCYCDIEYVVPEGERKSEIEYLRDKERGIEPPKRPVVITISDKKLNRIKDNIKKYGKEIKDLQGAKKSIEAIEDCLSYKL